MSALGTLVIAYLTLQNVKIAGGALQAQERPLLVDVPPSAPRPADMPFEEPNYSEETSCLNRDSGKELFRLNFAADCHVVWIDPRWAYARNTSKGVFVSFPLRNVGPGLAQIERVELPDFPDLQLRDSLDAPDCHQHFVIRKRQVPAGETVRIDIVMLGEKGPSVLEGKTPLSVDVGYFDTSRSQKRSVHVELSPGRDQPCCRYVRVLKHHPPTA